MCKSGRGKKKNVKNETKLCSNNQPQQNHGENMEGMLPITQILTDLKILNGKSVNFGMLKKLLPKTKTASCCLGKERHSGQGFILMKISQPKCFR